MIKPHWILQQNLIKESVFQQIKDVLKEDHISYEEVKIIPFSDELPNIQSTHPVNVFYGSTTLILNAYKHSKFSKSIFYDEDLFTIKNYMDKWGDYMLNADSNILTFKEIVEGDYNKGEWFLRPIHDDKSFSGKVMTSDQIIQIENSLKESNNPYLNEETLVAISKPKQIAKEWRHFIVNGEIISTSKYAEEGQPSKSSRDIPQELIQFVRDRCREYMPHPVFVMDTALYNNSFKIVECNCFNDTGFYDHDIKKVIRAVNAYLMKHK